MNKAVLFDFNGTLFFDFEYHISAWQTIVDELSGGKIDFLSFFKARYGMHNNEFIRDVLKACQMECDNNAVCEISQRKEALYRHIAKESGAKLAPGAEELFNELKAKGIKMTIVSASIIANIDFYFEHFDLKRWFNYCDVIYDNGNYHDKVLMYKDAAEKLKVDINDCLVFEDSINGMRNALDAGCFGGIYVDSSNLPCLSDARILQVIKDYNDFDRHLLD